MHFPRTSYPLAEKKVPRPSNCVNYTPFQWLLVYCYANADLLPVSVTYRPCSFRLIRASIHHFGFVKNLEYARSTTTCILNKKQWIRNAGPGYCLYCARHFSFAFVRCPMGEIHTISMRRKRHNYVRCDWNPDNIFFRCDGRGRTQKNMHIHHRRWTHSNVCSYWMVIIIGVCFVIVTGLINTEYHNLNWLLHDDSDAYA